MKYLYGSHDITACQMLDINSSSQKKQFSNNYFTACPPHYLSTKITRRKSPSFEPLSVKCRILLRGNCAVKNDVLTQILINSITGLTTIAKTLQTGNSTLMLYFSKKVNLRKIPSHFISKKSSSQLIKTYIQCKMCAKLYSLCSSTRLTENC